MSDKVPKKKDPRAELTAQKMKFVEDVLVNPNPPSFGEYAKSIGKNPKTLERWKNEDVVKQYKDKIIEELWNQYRVGAIKCLGESAQNSPKWAEKLLRLILIREEKLPEETEEQKVRIIIDRGEDDERVGVEEEIHSVSVAEGSSK